MADDSGRRPDCLFLYLCTQLHCTRHVVRLKIHTADVAARELTGPDLAQALRALVTEKGWGDRVQVRETSCMRGCLVGPRLNVVGAGGFKDAVRYLHLPATKPALRCVAWEAVTSAEALLDEHLKVTAQKENARLL